MQLGALSGTAYSPCVNHRAVLWATASSCALGFFAARAHAEPNEPHGAGIAGGALLGAEAVVLAEAMLDVEPAWAYLVGGSFGGAAGAYAGLRVENDAEPSASVWMLALGMGLAIPTVIWVGRAREPRPGGAVPLGAPPPAPRGAPGDARRDGMSPGLALTIPLVAGVW